MTARFMEANMGSVWDRQDPGEPHVGPMNFAIWGTVEIPHDAAIVSKLQ